MVVTGLFSQQDVLDAKKCLIGTLKNHNILENEKTNGVNLERRNLEIVGKWKNPKNWSNNSVFHFFYLFVYYVGRNEEIEKIILET